MSRYEPDLIEMLERIAVNSEAINLFLDGMECARVDKIYNVRRKVDEIKNMIIYVANGIERMKKKEGEE